MFFYWCVIILLCELIMLVKLENIVIGTNVTTITTTVEVTKEFKVEKNITDYDWDVWCKFQPNGYDCTGHGMGSPMFYYDIKMDDCKAFSFGKCASSKNYFETITLCHENCRDPGPRPLLEKLPVKIYCRFQPDFGLCNDYHPMFYYDITLQSCKGFSYSGCGGNSNRFPSPEICNAICGGVMEY